MEQLGVLFLLTLPTGRGSNTRCGVTVTLLEWLIVEEVPSAAAQKVDVTGEIVGDVDGFVATTELSLAHEPTPRETKAHDRGVNGGLLEVATVSTVRLP